MRVLVWHRKFVAPVGGPLPLSLVQLGATIMNLHIIVNWPPFLR